MKLRSSLLGLAIASVAFGASAAECTNDTWNKVMERGKIVVGVKADYKPWGYRDTNGDLVGMEIDMAKDVATKMG
ncbi:MAG: transporter substrate-binding domain-containing protein, partial [Pseudomonadota bacterium]